MLGLDQIPFEFNLKTKVYGQNLSNVKHIEKVTGALLLLEGYKPDSVYSAANKSPYLLIK